MVELTELDGVAEGRAENLREEGYESVEDLADADPDVVGGEVSYVPEDTALDLVVQSQNVVAEQEADIEESQPVTEEIADAVDEEDETDDAESDEDVADDEEEIEEETESDESGGPDVYEFTLTFNEELEFDTFFDAVMGQRATMLRSNRNGVDAFDHALDQMRSSSGVKTTVEFEMDEAQLNDLHNCVRQTMIAYKGDNLIDHMDALKRVLSEINEVREENLF